VRWIHSLQESKRKEKNVDFVKRKIIIYVNDENQNSSSDNNNGEKKGREKIVCEKAQLSLACNCSCFVVVIVARSLVCTILCMPVYMWANYSRRNFSASISCT
jgi:hypothetical protein